MKNRIRIYQSDYPYHIFNRTNNQEFLFNPARDFPIFMACLTQTTETTNFRPHHLTVLHNHYHMTASTPGGNLSEAMRLFQSLVSKIINSNLKRKNHIFGSRYGARVVRSHEYQVRIPSYLYNNAPKAGLAQRPSDYPYSTLQYYLDGTWKQRGLFLDPLMEKMSVEERKRYLEKLSGEIIENEEAEEIELAMERSQVL